MRKFGLLLAAGLLGFGGMAAASTINFNPNGTGAGGAGELLNVNTFDWTVGNALAENAIPTSGDQNNPTTFTQLFQAKLGTFTILGGGSVAPSGYEVTVVAGYQGSAYVSGGIVNLSSAAGLPNFLQIWIDHNPNADDLAGTGFQDGKLILTAVVDSASGFVNVKAPVQLFDGFGTDDFAGQKSLSGIGALDLQGVTTWYDTKYFTGPTLPKWIALEFSTTTTSLPFLAVDPSKQFWNGTAFVGTNLGGINGNLNSAIAPLGKDIQLQADASTTFTTVIPTPASVWAGLTLLSGMVAWRRIRRRNEIA